MLEVWTVTEGAKGPSSGRRVSAMQLFWLHSCHWPPGNAATTGSSSKALQELARSRRTDQACSWDSLGIRDAPWGIPGNDPPQFLGLHLCAEIPLVTFKTNSGVLETDMPVCFCFAFFPSGRETLAYFPSCWQVC